MWGQVEYERTYQNPMRIIPTRVGTSIHQCLILLFKMDHPHACGDKLSAIGIRFRRRGSSPRVWGQDYANFCVAAKQGDHPHACGDKIIVFGGYACFVGSSPRVWGQGAIAKYTIIQLRIIPTRVGTSLKPDRDNVEDEDHPHACGDK